MDSGPGPADAPATVDLVHDFLRGQNLEQVGRVDEAVELYEHAIRAAFDSPGPYDRLIEIYSSLARHMDAARVAATAIDAVHTHRGKRQWYERMLESARAAAAKVPEAAPKKPRA